MPYWQPKVRKLEDDIAAEQARLQSRFGSPRFVPPDSSFQAFLPQETVVPDLGTNIPEMGTFTPTSERPQFEPFTPEVDFTRAPTNRLTETMPFWLPSVPDYEAPAMTEPPPMAEQEADVPFYAQPKALAEKGMEKLAEGISHVPILPDVLKPVGKAFAWVHENLEKPFAAIITSPFSPDLAWRKGESWLAHQKREYDAWEAPIYVKGAAEFAMPLWWMPWFTWAKAGAKALSVGSKATAAMAKTGKALTVAERGLPAGELLDATLFRAGALRSASSHIPVVNKIVKMIGGEGAFITKKEALRVSQVSKVAGTVMKPADALTKTRMELVKLGFISDMRNGVKSLHVPRLQVMGDQSKILGMDAKGVVGNIVDKSGKSQYLYDVLEGALKDPDNYKFLTKEAKQYVETLGSILDDTFKLAKKEGVKVPKGRIVHRIVKGKTSPVTGQYEASEYGSLFEMARSHKTMAEGVRAGVDYGTDVAESVSSTIDHYVKAIARKRFEKEIGRLGKRPIDIFAERFPSEAALISSLGAKMDSAKYAAQAIKRVSSYQGKRIPASVMRKIRTELPDIASKLDVAFTLSPDEANRIITKVANAQRKALRVDAKDFRETLRIINRVADAFKNPENVGKILKGEIDDAIQYTSSKAGEASRIAEEVYREVYNSKKTLVNSLLKSTRGDLDNILEITKSEINPLKADRRQFLLKYQGKQILGENEAKFARHPAFKNTIFPKEVVKTTEKLLMDDGQAWLRQAANVSGMSRMLTAAMDLSAPFIQGASAWGRNPVAWAKGVKGMFEFAFDPQNYYKYLASPNVAAVRMERILHGGSSSTFEYFKALAPLQRGVGKIPVAGKGIKAAIAQSWGRAETAFTGFGEVARNEMWKALRYRAVKGGQLSDDLAMDLARTVDRMTGVMSTEALAIGRSQQDFENAFVFFAPRYTRAGLAFAGDALKGGMTGAEARKSIASLMLAGTAFYYGASRVLGQQPNFNPNSGRFMTIQVGDSHIGVGGIMTALLRLAYDVGITAKEDPINLVKPLTEGHLNRWDNPFIRFLYARTSPLTSLITSAALEQTNYFGEPLESVGDWATFMKDKVTPIALQNAMRDPQPFVIAAEFGGLRAFPKSSWELLDEERDKVAQETFNDLYDNLNDLNKVRVNKEDTVRKLQKDVDASTVTRGDAVSVAFLNRQRERESARAVYEETLWGLQKAYDAGAIDGSKFREEMSNAGYGLGKTYEHIDSQPEYKEVMKVFEKPRALKDKTIEDIAYSEYMDTLYKNNEFEDQYGLFDFKKFNQFIETFKSKWGDEIYQYIIERKAERDSTLPPLAQEYQKAKEVLKPYWAVADRVEQMFGKFFASTSRGQSLISKMRKQMRVSNPELARYYDMFYARAKV